MLTRGLDAPALLFKFKMELRIARGPARCERENRAERWRSDSGLAVNVLFGTGLPGGLISVIVRSESVSVSPKHSDHPEVQGYL